MFLLVAGISQVEIQEEKHDPGQHGDRSERDGQRASGGPPAQRPEEPWAAAAYETYRSRARPKR